MDDCLSYWKDGALQLLRQASGSMGIRASLQNHDNYNAIFTRDAVMAGIAGLLLDDVIVIRGLENTLLQLRKLQGQQGQVPSNYQVRDDAIDSVSYGTLSPKLDACMWYLIGIGLMIRCGHVKGADYRESVNKVVYLLEAIEYNGNHLIYMPRGGNWADEYVYEGYILSDQVLRAWALSILGQVYGRKQWSEKSKKIYTKIEKLYKAEGMSHYYCSISPARNYTYFDLAAHALLGVQITSTLKGLSNSYTWLMSTFVNKGKLPPVFDPVIVKGDCDWDLLSNYHLFEFRNKPYHYHNGGIWFIWLGWLSIGLTNNNLGQYSSALIELVERYLGGQLKFEFEEYISSDNLHLCGTQQLCYSATGILFLWMTKNNYNFEILE